MSVLEFRVWNEIYKRFVYSNDFNELENKSRLSQFFDWAKKYASKYPIQQYVGLEDKNGRKIYEGDIVEREFNEYGNEFVYYNEIVFDNGTFGFCLERGELIFQLIKPQEYEVVGNIFENPKLINK
jgi:uncharacterized phage protein (TIGR01671 family)